ncbi:MAG: hypothetical protein IPF84_04210 [Proteobacteria bacterium]|nr:hypothetical protein [Pseudomonadota bacterium]
MLSGGEKGRVMCNRKMMLTRPNVMLMDEPTNHMDMETIESLQIRLEVPRARADLRVPRSPEFVGGLTNRARSSRSPSGSVTDFTGTYDEYLAAGPRIPEPGPRPVGLQPAWIPGSSRAAHRLPKRV